MNSYRTGEQVEIQGRRRAIWETYDAQLAGWAEKEGVRRPVVPDDAGQAWHMYYLLLPSLEVRQTFIAHLRARGILSVFHYLPLQLSEMGRRFGGQSGACPVAEEASDRLVRLPFFYSLTESEQSEVVDAVRAFRVKAA